MTHTTSIHLTFNDDGTADYQMTGVPIKREDLDHLSLHLNNLAEQVANMPVATIH